MTTNDIRINQLLAKLEILLERQENFSKDINELSEEIYRLKYAQAEEPIDEWQEAETNPPVTFAAAETEKESVAPNYQASPEQTSVEPPRYFSPVPDDVPEVKSNLEKFIGENLINKIGIIITVIGVAIGAKYSIDHQLISPLTRIILGYLMGLGLLGIGIKLKKNYENYSAVLVSGAIAIMYFITYAAYSFYDLIPQTFAFILMVVFTAFTVVAAINFNKQVIAHIGMVGAYAVPFLLSNESGREEIFLLLANSFIFYGLGYSILKTNETGESLLGLFTLCNAVLHFIVSVVIYRQKLADRNLFYLVSGLVLVFITIAIPVQLDGNWVILLWASEAALLFWIGRTKNVYFYEQLSYVLMILAFISIGHDWSTVYSLYDPKQPETRILPLFNINFLTSLLFIISFGFINILNRNPRFRTTLTSRQGLSEIVSYLIPAIFLVVLYSSLWIEISTYWNQLYIDSVKEMNHEGANYLDRFQNDDLLNFKTIWILNYSLLFMYLLSLANVKKLRNRELGYINLGFSTLGLLLFLVLGLYSLGCLLYTSP